MMQSVPILMYHQVSPQVLPTFRKYSVTPHMFAGQMNWLARAGYTAIDQDTLLMAHLGHAPLPVRPVVITFDDGLRDCAQFALPILQARGCTAIFYLVAGLMGRTSEWLRAKGVELPIMDWTCARALRAEGMRVGAHTLTHPNLTALSNQDCQRELKTARDILENELGHLVAHLAYPFGKFDERVRAAAIEAGYASACTTEIGLSRGEDAFALRRVPVTGEDTLLDFISRLRNGYPARQNLLAKAHAGQNWLRAKKSVVMR